MNSTGVLNILFVINPISGGREKDTYETAIKDHFRSSPHNISFYMLNGKNDAQQLDKKIGAEKPGIVVAVGGDGTVSMVAKKLLGTEIKLAIIPAGSANGMARELNIPIDIAASLEIIEKGHERRIDVINVNRRLCLHLSDIGLNARLIKYFEQGNMRGKWGYAKVALKVFLQRQHMRVIIHTADTEIRRDAFMVVLANASKYGTGAVINPKGKLYDGLFEVVIIRRLAFVTLLKMWLKPRAFDPSHIEVIQARSVHIQTQRKVHFQVDGEYIGRVHHVDAEIQPSKLHILLPE